MTKKYRFRDLSKPAPATVYIGSERYSILEQCAEELSSSKNMQVKVSEILKFLIDEHLPQAVVGLGAMMDKVKIGN